MRQVYILLSLLVLTISAHAQWTPANGPGDGSPITVLAASKSTLFLGSSAGISRSTDRGATWYESFKTPEVRTILTDQNSVFVGTNYGVYRSDDLGVSWREIDSTLTNVYGCVEIVGSRSDLYALIQGGIVHSTDAGDTWRVLRDFQYGGFGFDTLVNNLLVLGPYMLAGTNGYGLQRSSDGGATWMWVTKGLPTDEPVLMQHQVKQTAYLSCYSGLFRSVDSGASWKPANSGLHANVLCMVDRNDTLFVGTSSDSVFFSSDLGDSWWPRSEAIQNRNRMITALTVTNDLLVCASSGSTEGSIYTSSNAGSQWINRGNGLSLANVECLQSINGRLFASGQYIGLKYSDDGLTWKPSTSLPGESAIMGIGSIILSSGPPVSWSDDRGESWHSSVRDDKIGGVYRFGALDSICFAGSVNGIERSADSGRTWTLTDGPRPIYSLGSFKSNMFAGTYDSGIYRSNDAGLSWSHLNSIPDSLDIRVIEHSDHSIFAGNDTYGGVYRSRDLGDTWQASIAGMPRSIWGFPYVYALATKGDTIFAGGDGVFESKDDGDTWEDVGDDLPGSTIQSLAIFGDYLYAATQENGVWRRPLSELGVHASVTRPKAGSEHVTLAPNPVLSSTTLSFTTEHSGSCQIDVYDAAGRLIETVFDGALSTGDHAFVWKPEKLASGVYMIIVRCEGRAIAVPVVLQH